MFRFILISTLLLLPALSSATEKLTDSEFESCSEDCELERAYCETAVSQLYRACVQTYSIHNRRCKTRREKGNRECLHEENTCLLKCYGLEDLRAEEVLEP